MPAYAGCVYLCVLFLFVSRGRGPGGISVNIYMYTEAACIYLRAKLEYLKALGRDVQRMHR